MADIDLKTILTTLREIDFTALDYETLQQELIEYITIAQTNEGIVDDFLEGDAARVFIDLFSYLGEILAFRVDTLANETYLSTAQRRQSIINLLELVAQRPKNPTTATLQLVAVPSSVSNSSIPITPRFNIETTGLDGNSVNFEIMNGETDYFTPVVIPAGVTNFNITAFSGSYTTFDTTSTGEPGLEIILPEFPVIEGSVKVSVTPISSSFLTPEIIESTRVREVETLVDSADEIIYRLRFDEDGRGILTFASSAFGRIPPNGHTIHIDYRTGGGDNTNIGVGVIEASSTFVNAAGTNINVTFANPETFATGGEPLEDLEDVRLRVPGIVRANENLVTTDDYEAIISRIPGVQDVFAVDRFQDTTQFNSQFGVPDNSVNIWILPTTGGEISPDLRQRIAIELESRRLSAIENFVFNPIYLDWSLNADVNITSFADTNTVRANVQQALLDRFGRGTALFKQELRVSQIISTIQGIEGVDYVNITSPAADIEASKNEVLRLLASNISLFIQ